jgi:hypothetical protein
MTNEQILELASQYLHYDVDGDRACEWRGEYYELLKFARAIRKETIEEVTAILMEGLEKLKSELEND